MSAKTAALVVALGLLAPSTGPAPAPGASKPATHTITIDGTRFQPEAISVAVGDVVIWVNKDPFPHTATSKAGGFDSREIQPGASWKYVPKSKGESRYVCTFHPTMTGVLRVR